MVKRIYLSLGRIYSLAREKINTTNKILLNKRLTNNKAQGFCLI